MSPTLQRLSASSGHGALILAAALFVGTPGEARARGVETPMVGPTASPAVHQVMAGETLSGIAATYGLDWRDLARANRISDPRRLKVGRALTVAGVLSPSDRRHRVRRGETLSGIARRYGVAWRDLAALNGLADPDRLATGTTLVIDHAVGRVAPLLRTAEARDRFAIEYGVAKPAVGDEKIATAATPPTVLPRQERVARVLAEAAPSRVAAASAGGEGNQASPLSWEDRARADFTAQLAAFAARYDVNRVPPGRRHN